MKIITFDSLIITMTGLLLIITLNSLLPDLPLILEINLQTNGLPDFSYQDVSSILK